VLEFDHCLRIGEPASHLVPKVSGRSVEFLIEAHHAFSNEIESLLESLGRQVEMPTHLGYGTFEQPPQIVVGHAPAILTHPLNRIGGLPDIDSQLPASCEQCQVGATH
jgi:hypothetical protein